MHPGGAYNEVYSSTQAACMRYENTVRSRFWLVINKILCDCYCDIMRTKPCTPRSVKTMRRQHNYGTPKNWLAIRQVLLYCTTDHYYVCRVTVQQMIPKIFHYIWVGGSPLPSKSVALIDGVKALHPDFIVRVWDENNATLTPPFVQRCYQKGMWAFVSDYLRFHILYQYGGIYLDTDMEVIRPLDALLDSRGFAGLNSAMNLVYAGIIGAEAEHPLMSRILKDYDALPADSFPISPTMLTNAYQQAADDSFDIYPYEAFYPCRQGEPISATVRATAYAVHHWDESWRSFVSLRRILRKIGLMDIYHRFTVKTHTLQPTVPLLKKVD